MDKWQHLRMTAFGTDITIFPADRVNLDWLFLQYPKIKKDKKSTNNNLLIKLNSEEDLHMIEKSILNYLEEAGWEGYSAMENWNFIAFKRKVE
jgi:methanogenic corrinoid protein MtbC1